jgi:hypothetical protein
MGKQVHFVIVADIDSETWWVDEELTFARFDKETTWNVDAEEWEATTTDDYFKSLQILNKGRES